MRGKRRRVRLRRQGIVGEPYCGKRSDCRSRQPKAQPLREMNRRTHKEIPLKYQDFIRAKIT